MFSALPFLGALVFFVSCIGLLTCVAGLVFGTLALLPAAFSICFFLVTLGCGLSSVL
jgi:hypothetical protein